MLLIMKNSVLHGKNARYDKILVGKVVCLRNIYKFSIYDF